MSEVRSVERCGSRELGLLARALCCVSVLCCTCGALSGCNAIGRLYDMHCIVVVWSFEGLVYGCLVDSLRNRRKQCMSHWLTLLSFLSVCRVVSVVVFRVSECIFGDSPPSCRDGTE